MAACTSDLPASPLEGIPRLPDEDAVVGRVLRSLLSASTSLHPDDIPATVAEAAAAMGAGRSSVHLVDLDQRVLRRLRSGGPDPAEDLALDATTAGAAYRQQRPTVDVAGTHPTLWLPLLDSADRLGVLGIEIAGPTCGIEAWQDVALLVAELVVSKSPYGDGIALTRRTGAVELAAEMRWSLLPPLTFATRTTRISGILQPGHDIAGDAFDYGIHGDVLSLMVLDAMGHGDEASRIANVAVAAYRNARRSGSSPADTIRTMDREVARAFQDRFVTAQVATLDTVTGMLRLLNAGHPLPLLFRGRDAVEELPCRPCMPVGVGSVPAHEAEHRLHPGDAVLFYTDGVVEGRDEDGVQFGEQRLAETMVASRGATSVPAEVLRLVARTSLDHEGGQAADDASLILLEWLGPDASG